MKNRRGYYRSSSFKMAALFTVLLGLSALLLVYFLYDLGKQNFISETEAAIDSEIEHILAITRTKSDADVIDYIARRVASSNHPIYLYQDNDGATLAGNIVAVPDEVIPIKEGVIRFNITSASEDMRIVAAKIHTFSTGARLLIARDISESIARYNRLKILSAIILVFMVLVVLISFFISVFVVTRINNIANTALQIIETGDLSRRIEIDSHWDDLSYLGATLNDLLARIESLMQGIRDVSDNIAHDLKTPLTRLRGHLEALKGRRLSTSDMDKLVSEADNILGMFNALLRIANIEKGKQKQSFADLDLAQLLNDVVELYEPLALQRDITMIVNATIEAPIYGDRDLLFQMFANIVDNAIKFSEHRGTLTLSIEHDRTGYHIIIADNGVGIATDEISKVFDRFYRSDKSRHTVGSGLGLSMVKAVAELHGITLQLSDNNPGLRFKLSFS